MKRIKEENIKCVLMNPEKLPEAKRKLMEFLYEEYMKSKQAEI